MIEPKVEQLEIPADSRFVAAARNFVAEAARSTGWMVDSQVDDLRLVVSETVTNSLRAQAEQRVDDPIVVRSTVFEDRVEVSVTDSAGGFEVPASLSDLPDPDPDTEGGFGLPLMEALSDQVHFTRTDEGTVVRVVVYRDPSRR